MSNYTIDIRDAGFSLQAERFRVGDNGMRSLVFHLTDGKNAFSLPDECIATLFARLPSGATLFESLTVSGDSIIYTPRGGEGAPSVTSEEGCVLCEIRITSTDGRLITCPSFSFIVEGVLQKDGAIEAESSFSALTDALGRVLDSGAGLSSKIDRADGAEGNIAVLCKNGGIADGGIAAGDIATAEWVRAYVDEAIVEGEW